MKTTVEKESAALLEWVQRRIPDFHVVDFSSSWRNGHALCGLINSLQPGTLDLPAQYKDTALETAAMAIDVADRLLGIDPILSANDVCNDDTPPDMIALYIKCFQLKQQDMLLRADQDERARRRKAAAHKAARQKPAASDVWCNVVSKTGAYHASIALDGTVEDRFGDLLGYLDLDDLKAASPAQQLVGYIMADSLYDCRHDSSGVFCGEMNRGTSCLHDEHGSTIVALDATGVCKAPSMDILGTFEGCTRAELPIVSLYCMFLDCDFCNAELYDEVERQPVEAPDVAWTNVYDKEAHFYASIDAEEGRVTDSFGELVGLIDLEGKRCADPQGRLLGAIVGDQVLGGDDDGVYLGEIDRGRGYVMDRTGSSVLSLDATGHCKGLTSVYLGEFRGCGYRELEIIALFVLCLMPDFLREY